MPPAFSPCPEPPPQQLQHKLKVGLGDRKEFFCKIFKIFKICKLCKICKICKLYKICKMWRWSLRRGEMSCPSSSPRCSSLLPWRCSTVPKYQALDNKEKLLYWFLGLLVFCACSASYAKHDIQTTLWPDSHLLLLCCVGLRCEPHCWCNVRPVYLNSPNTGSNSNCGLQVPMFSG